MAALDFVLCGTCTYMCRYMCAVCAHSVMSDSLQLLDCIPPCSSIHGDSQGKNTGVGCHALLQRIFPVQALNSGLPHSRWILYRLSHQGSLGKSHELRVGRSCLRPMTFPCQLCYLGTKIPQLTYVLSSYSGNNTTMKNK